MADSSSNEPSTNPSSSPAQREAVQRARRLALELAHATLVPQVSFDEFVRRVARYQRTCLGRVQHDGAVERTTDPELRRQLPDNSWKFESVKFSYLGFEPVAAHMQAGRPVCLLGWHHGANEHCVYALIRIIQSLTVFTLRTGQFGRVFSNSTSRLGARTVASMRSALNAGKPLFYYVDGIPLGNTASIPMLGYPSNITTTPVEYFCSVEDLQLIPVSSVYHGPGEVRTIFHEPLARPAGDGDSANEIIAATLGILTDELRRRAPFQVIPRFLAHREERALQIQAGSSVSPNLLPRAD